MLNQAIFDAIVLLLAGTNAMQSEDARSAHVRAVFTELRERPDIDCAGAPRVATQRIVQTCGGFGTLPSGQLALVRLLDLARPEMGDQRRIDRLVAAVQQDAAMPGTDWTAATHPDGPAPITDPRMLHEEYLRRWFTQPWSRVSLADLTGEDKDVALLDVYVPLQVDFSLKLRVDKRKIVDWYASQEREITDPDSITLEKSQAVIRERQEELRAWPALGVGEAELQCIVDAVQHNRLDRRSEEEWEQLPEEFGWYMEAHDAASVQPHFVLVGEPGSGKSSFVRHLTLCMAGAQLQEMGAPNVPDNASLLALRDWLLGSYTPVFLELADVVKQVFPKLPEDESEQPKLPGVDQLWRYVREHVLGKRLAAYESHLLQHMRDGKAIVLLDGLDEVNEATDERRIKQIKAFIGALCQQYPKTHVIVTSRPYAYMRGGWDLQGFGRAELVPLSLSRLMELAQALFTCLIPDQPSAQNEISAFEAALKEVPDDLRRNPLFFTLLAAIWLHTAGEHRLPTTRAGLYRTSVDLMLAKWTAKRGADQTPAQRLKLEAEQLRVALQMLACRVHGANDNASKDAIEFHRKELQDVLEDIQRNAPGSDVLDWLEQRAGILVSGRPKYFRFAHQSFQEHLAACELTQPTATARTRHPPVDEADRFPSGIAQRIHSKPDVWRNVALLAADELAVQRGDDLDRMLGEFIRPCVSSHDQPSMPARHAALLALEMARAHERLTNDSDPFSPRAPLLLGLGKVALNLLTDLDFEPEQRLIAGKALAELGDLRRGVGLDAHELPDIDWVTIADDGEFTYGEGETERKMRLKPYEISRYPITYAQFQAFLDARDGFCDPRWWKELAAEEGHRQKPGEQQFEYANHPRERVSWYDAVAFCRWLSHKTGKDISLPSEEEWEKAARGIDGRAYPWGDKYLEGFANIDETGGSAGSHYLKMTSAVGMYPQGHSPYDVLDMSGNVWEWCLNEYEKPDNTQMKGDARRVLRGGSWYDDQDDARCAYRYWDDPYLRLNYFGFRVVVRSAPVP